MRSPRLQDLAARTCAALPGAFGAIIVQVFVDGQPTTGPPTVRSSRSTPATAAGSRKEHMVS